MDSAYRWTPAGSENGKALLAGEAGVTSGAIPQCLVDALDEALEAKAEDLQGETWAPGSRWVFCRWRVGPANDLGAHLLYQPEVVGVFEFQPEGWVEVSCD